MKKTWTWNDSALLELNSALLALRRAESDLYRAGLPKMCVETAKIASQVQRIIDKTTTKKEVSRCLTGDSGEVLLRSC